MLSILIPAYNAERYVRDAVLSAHRQIRRFDQEILVCDDGSSDRTADVLNTLRQQVPCLRVITHETNQGVSAARNSLIDAIHPASEFVAFFDADDIYRNGALGRSLELLRNTPDADFTYGRMQVVSSPALDSGKIAADEWPILQGVTLSASLFRRDVIRQAGLFDTSFTQGEDLDYLLRIVELTDRRLLHDDVVFYYRRHGSNATSDPLAVRRGFMRAVMLHARRRAANPALHDAKGLFPQTDREIIARVAAVNG